MCGPLGMFVLNSYIVAFFSLTIIGLSVINVEVDFTMVEFIFGSKEEVLLLLKL